MNKFSLAHAKRQLAHLYISPLSACNLACQICYTAKNQQTLSKEQILTFVSNYQQSLKTDFKQNLETITFCGGEVFLLADFVDLVNQLTAQQIFVQIITNGTIDKLDKIRQPNWVNLIVSLDGLPADHDLNRGQGNFAKSLAFLKKAQELGFHYEIFSIVTAQNYEKIEAFENYLKGILTQLPNITYHPRKPLSYLDKHQTDNVRGETKNFQFINHLQLKTLRQHKAVFPPVNLGCYQLALNSDGQVYSCCEGVKPLGKITDAPQKLIEQFLARVDNSFNHSCKQSCLGCTEPAFLCGLDANDFLESKYEAK